MKYKYLMQYIYPLKLPRLKYSTHTSIMNYVYATAGMYSKNIKQHFPEYIEQDHYRQSYHLNSNTENDIAEYSNWFMSDSLIQEIQNDLTDELYPFSQVTFYFQYMNKGGTIAPHRDLPRNMSFLYMLGGFDEKGLTHFYNDLVNDSNRWLYDSDEVEGPIQTFQMKTGQWYIMRHDVIHGVTQISKDRLAIVADFSKDYHYDEWINEHQNLIDTSFEKFHYVNLSEAHY